MHTELKHLTYPKSPEPTLKVLRLVAWMISELVRTPWTSTTTSQGRTKMEQCELLWEVEMGKEAYLPTRNDTGDVDKAGVDCLELKAASTQD